MRDLPPIDYQRTEPSRKAALRPVHYLLIVGVAALFIVVILLPSLVPDRLPARQVKCASNLRQIGQALTLYTLANKGAFPPDLQTIAMSQPIGLDVMVCPSSADKPPSSPSAIGTARSCSYIYVGAGLTTKANPECILALEDPANHGLEGGNVLFADGHVEFCDLPAIQLFLNELSAGRNPPATLTPTLSRAGAEQDYQKNWKSRMPQLKTGIWRIPTTQPTDTPK